MLDDQNGQNQMLGDVSGVSLPSDNAPMGNIQPADNSPAATMGIQPLSPVQPSDDTPNDNSAVKDELLDIKQKALGQLGPIINKLDQTPEEKFRTTMMMIQASDNRGLISQAYEAAEQIGDEKEKAQALLDVINEINYFSQKDKN
jgi:hypothetical protein